MSEPTREHLNAILREHGTALCVNGLNCAHFSNCRAEQSMAREIATLRARLAEVERERDDIMSQLSDYTQEVLALRTEADRLRAVVEAARAYVGAYEKPGHYDADGLSNCDRTHDALLASVRALDGGDDAQR